MHGKKTKKNAIGCSRKRMRYFDYKMNWYWLNTALDSYDSSDKTVDVYIPDKYAGLEDIISAMAETGRKCGFGHDAYIACAEICQKAFNNGKITEKQVKVLQDIANSIRRRSSL